MTQITIYRVTTGEISRRMNISGPAEALAEQVLANLADGEDWIAGIHDEDTHRIWEGAPRALPPRPGDWAVLDTATWAWIDPRTPAELAAEALAALVAARSAAMAQVLAWIAEASIPLTGGVPLEEMLSWTAKEAAAEAVLAGTATSGQLLMIGAEAALTGEDLPVLCEIILAKSAAYNAAVGIISGLRRLAEVQLAAVTDPAACEPVAQAAIAAAASALGL